MEVRGRGETLTVEEPPLAPGFFSNEIIRIHPRRVNSWHIDPDRPALNARNVG
ncbi:MAG: hypothetical protein ACJ72W_09855 [Actinoallomurus sp.]